MKFYMKPKAIFIAALCMFALSIMPFAPSASAQQDMGDIGDIIDDIFKNGNFPKQGQKRDGQERESQQGRIDNIPVDVRFDTKGRTLPEESMLIVTAYAPPPPNVRRSSPLMIGQTHLLMAGLGSPAQIIVAAPSSITQDLEYARIEAKIVDMNGATIFELPFPGKYQGYEAPVLNLIYVGNTSELPPITSPAPTYPTAPFSTETVRGTVKLNGRAPKFSGSNLVVRLIEDGLAGGTSRMIAGETRQVLDNKRAPFDFEFERVIDTSKADTPLALKVWIEDWAGRKTHVTPSPIPYNGSKTKYRIRLDAIGPLPYNPLPICTPENPCTNMPTLPDTIKPEPKPTPKPTPKSTPKPIPKPKPIVHKPIPPMPIIRPKPAPVSAFKVIKGEAHFDADKGLPKGSVLIAVLERQDSTPRPATLASTRIFLDGMSGNIDFKLTANTVDLAPNLPAPMLRVRIEDKDGTLFFSNPGGTKWVQGFNTVQLRKSAYY